MNKLTIKDLVENNLTYNKKILIRVDFNVPMKDGSITNNQRIIASLPTIKYLIENGNTSSIILVSHLGRPNCVISEKFSLKPIHKELEKLLNKKIIFLKDFRQNNLAKIWTNNEKGQIFLFENVRFNIPETGKYKLNNEIIKCNNADIELFKNLLNSICDIFINDAFGTSHRGHSSMVFSKHNINACGLLVEKELLFFNRALNNPKKPLLCILGGSKVSDKIKLIYNLIDKANDIIIGGGMAYTFKKVIFNVNIGNSLFDVDAENIVVDIMNKAQEKNVNIHLPVDHVIADNFSNNSNIKIVNDEEGIGDGWMGLDIGPLSIKYFSKVIFDSNTIIWNGPMGVFEFENFNNGTKKILEAVCDETNKGKLTIVGGGDTATAVKMFNCEDKITHVSTGGGASLELMEGKELPGISILSNKN